LFLDDPTIPATNNTSEQALRWSVIFRKVTNGFRSDWGRDLFAVVRFIVNTGKRQGLSAFESILAALNPLESLFPLSWAITNEVLAQELQKRLDYDLQKIVELKKRNSLDILLDLIFKRTPKIRKSNFDLRQYDRSILISPIWAGKIATPLWSFIQLEKDNFKAYSLQSAQGQRVKAKKILMSWFAWSKKSLKR
jgi:Transposase IS66 family